MFNPFYSFIGYGLAIGFLFFGVCLFGISVGGLKLLFMDGVS